MRNLFTIRNVLLSLCVVLIAYVPIVTADTVTDWNKQAGDIVVAANIGPLPAERTLAIAQAAVYEAVNAITRRYPISDLKLQSEPGASIEAAVAAANRTVLMQLIPNQIAAIDKAYQSAITVIKDESARKSGIAIGEQAAQGILAVRINDGTFDQETYRPITSAGVYIPTVIPETPQWAARKPWLMKNAAQFRPAAPPQLNSERWARDYNEVKALGRFDSQVRTAEQNRNRPLLGRSTPPIYHGIIRSVATQPGREITQNARLFAAVTQASDDALIAVFDAKYHYGLWRPLTAIRNGDIDGNDATERDAS